MVCPNCQQELHPNDVQHRGYAGPAHDPSRCIELLRIRIAALEAEKAALQAECDVAVKTVEEEMERHDATKQERDTISATCAALEAENAALRTVGNQMSNVCFNLSQLAEDEHPTARTLETMRDLAKQWDDALRKEGK